MTVSQLIELLEGYELEGQGDLVVGYWKQGFRQIDDVYTEEDDGDPYVVVTS